MSHSVIFNVESTFDDKSITFQLSIYARISVLTIYSTAQDK